MSQLETQEENGWNVINPTEAVTMLGVVSQSASTVATEKD